MVTHLHFCPSSSHRKLRRNGCLRVAGFGWQLSYIFIFSSSVEEHERHLGQVFAKLREAQLYLSWEKVDLYSERMDCQGHIITDAGIHADADKMQKIWDWRQPRNYHEVQRFLGLMQYLVHFMPDITTYTMPLCQESVLLR